MTIGDIIEILQDMDPDETATFQLITHSDMHIAAEAAGIDTDCETVDRALTLLSSMFRHSIGIDPYLLFKALGRAAALENNGEAPEQYQPIFH